jgi:hypothetical protein
VFFQARAAAVDEAKAILSIDRRGSKLGYYIDVLVNFQALLYSLKAIDEQHRR